MEIADISIYESGNGGDLALRANDIDIVRGFANQFYLALFGGNIEENTSERLTGQDQRNDWWGNNLIQEKFNSNFERELMNNPLNSGGIANLENSAKEDLKFMKAFGEVTVNASLIGIGKLQLEISLKEPSSRTTKVKYLWDGARKEIIQQILL